MKMDGAAFRQWKAKRITLMGMSGVGKTYLASMLPRDKWFHFSGDYRLGTRYLQEPILDKIKQQAMQVPFLADLLRSDSIYICSNITIDNLEPLTTFLGLPGNPALGGQPYDEFIDRLALYRQAEINAMSDVPEFIAKAQRIYGYQHFINDAGGSLCELEDEKVLEILAEHTLLLYIRSDPALERVLIKRTIAHPKPMYYRKEFLDTQMQSYLQEHDLANPDAIDPAAFVRWIFPRLLTSRLPRYQSIADRYGYTIPAQKLQGVASEEGLLEIIATTLDER